MNSTEKLKQELLNLSKIELFELIKLFGTLAADAKSEAERLCYFVIQPYLHQAAIAKGLYPREPNT